jgi:hypothetical protein
VARDLDADDRIDLASANRNSSTVSVLRNTSRPAVAFDQSLGLSFGAQPVGTASPSRTLTITNAGAAPLLVSSVEPSGADADEYSVSGDGCSGVPVLPGASCQASVRFRPVTAGAANAILRVVSNAPASPGGVPLTGTGTAAPPATAGATGPGGPQGPAGATGPQGPAGKNGRDAVVTCKPAKARHGTVKVTCVVKFQAASASTRVSARLSRGHRVYASGAGAVAPGARGTVALHAVRRLARGGYTLRLEFADARGRRTVIRQRVSVR